MSDWYIYQGTGQPSDTIEHLPAPPPWRRFSKSQSSFPTFQVGKEEIEVVNAALYLRRPLLLTGQPGTGKSSLAYAVAHELKLGPVLVWSITSRSTLQDALYRYDAIGRLQEANLYKNNGKEPKPQQIGSFIRLGPLGTAMLPNLRPRVLLIDEIDKSDIDLPNDLLHIFEEGHYEIPELARLADIVPEVSVFMHESDERASIKRGRVACTEFPFVVITSNGEREMPPAFYRRCVRWDIEKPSVEKLKKIVEEHFKADNLSSKVWTKAQQEDFIEKFIERRDGRGYIATDQLLNAIYLLKQGADLQKPLTLDNDAPENGKNKLIDVILHSLTALENQ